MRCGCAVGMVSSAKQPSGGEISDSILWKRHVQCNVMTLDTRGFSDLDWGRNLLLFESRQQRVKKKKSAC